MLTPEGAAACVAFRKNTLLPLDDCLYALQATIPHLTRSRLHLLYQRHDISRLPEVEGEKPKTRFKAYPIGYFHIDIAQVRTEGRKLYIFVAIERTSKFAFVELHEKATRCTAGGFLRRLPEAVPYTIHTVLTDKGTHFTDPQGGGWTVAEIKDMRPRIAGRQAPARSPAVKMPVDAFGERGVDALHLGNVGEFRARHAARRAEPVQERLLAGRPDAVNLIERTLADIG